ERSNNRSERSVWFTVAGLGPATSVCGPPTTISTRSWDCSWAFNGTSVRIRGGNIFGSPEAAAVVAAGASAIQGMGRGWDQRDQQPEHGGTDSTSFNNAGLPGIG